MLDYSEEYTISEVADITGYAPHVLRYYEKEFNIDIPRKESNHRYYTYKEIELINYIKSLKEKGFGNKQINLIINSPQEVLSSQENGAMVSLDNNEHGLEPVDIAMEISSVLEERFFEKLSEYLSTENNNTSDLIEDLKEEIIALRNEINSKERDVLICENAKLKMKVKEKTYENVKLKEDLRKLKSEKTSIFKRLFRFNNAD
ncbi:MerR family transcriptional regulator [Tissierellaceae bacterium HCP3S3_D8]